MTVTAVARRHGGVERQVGVLAAARAVNQLGAFSLAFLTVMLCRVLGASLASAGAVSALFGVATIQPAARRPTRRPARATPHYPGRPDRLRGSAARHRGRT